MANSDSTSMDELVKKKWLISRIDELHKTLHTELYAHEQRFENLAKKEENRIKSRRSEIWSGLGAVLTILIGLNTKLASIETLYILIAIDLGIGVIVYIIANWALKHGITITEKLSDAIVDAELKINESYGYFIAKTSKIQLVEYEFLETYFVFATILGLIVRIPVMSIVMEVGKNEIITEETKKELTEGKNKFVKLLENMMSSYNQLRTDELPLSLLEYVKANIDSYKKM